MTKWIKLVLILAVLPACSKDSGNSAFINPFIGTDGPGHTYPGPSMPFGMVQVGPDTRLEGWESCAGYHYSDSVIYGFSHTHLSGTGVSDYCDILLMPTSGDISIDAFDHSSPNGGYASKFSHQKEKASAGYYQVYLKDHRIKVELTASNRVGFHRYKYPKKEQANVILDLTHRDEVLSSYVKIINEYQIEGLRRSKSWAKDQYVYFVIEFSKPFKDYGLYLNNEKVSGAECSGTNVKAHFTFASGAGNQLLAKVAISAVSAEGARKNLSKEIPHWRFETTHGEAVEAWNNVLDRFELIDVDNETKNIFYTAVYHQYLNPNIYMDVDSMYRGRDMLVHKAEDFNNYTLFSLWDTFRATHPLFTIMERERTVNFIQTFLTQYDQGGMLPVWELSANETGTMIGYHAVSVIADAYMKGIRDFDVSKALSAMVNSADQNTLGLRQYKELGYVPANEESESVSKTLEYGYDDWCIAQVAKDQGHSELYSRFLERSLAYRNVYDPTTGFMRAKMGSFWFKPFDPKEVNFNYTEANAWQYNFFVPHDMEGLKDLLGGDDAMNNRLDSLFSESSETTGRKQADITGLIGQYAHGNEPSHNTAYLYAFSGEPWKSQFYIDKILREFYSNQPDGLCGNEDCGQMSAWYIFSSLGFYPVTPGRKEYIIGSPLIGHAKLHLENGNTFEIIAQNRSLENIYIQKAFLNDSILDKTYITHDQIINGGKLEFIMGPEPNKSWGSQIENRPPSSVHSNGFIPNPFILSGSRTFEGETMVELGCLDSSAQIYYQLVNHQWQGNNGNFKEYSQPIRIRTSQKLRFYASIDSTTTAISEALFYKLSSNRKVLRISEYANQYTAGGKQALIDDVRGSRNFRTGAWQGFEGTDLEVLVDLGFNQTINRLGLSCLQDQTTWIFMPEKVVYEISTDGEFWETVGEVQNDLDYSVQGTFVNVFTTDVWRSARYIRVKAYSIGVCPDWHPGAGEKSWLFADELVIE